MNKKIVTIGGGSGQSLLLSGLRDVPGIDITAVVSMFDSGGSTGRLREEYNVLPYGDIMKCILALSPEREKLEKFFKNRFELKGKLKEHSMGNLILFSLDYCSGDFVEAIKALSEALHIKGKVFPITTDKADIKAILKNGEEVFSETNIDIPKGKRSPIERIEIISRKDGEVNACGFAVEAIKKSDYMIISLGDFYTSIVPNLIVSGVKEVCQKYKGKIVYILNSLKKKGETDDFTSKDYVLNLEKYLGRKIDYVIFNKPDYNFKSKGDINEPIKEDSWEGRVVIKKALHDESAEELKYDGKKLAELIKKIIFK